MRLPQKSGPDWLFIACLAILMLWMMFSPPPDDASARVRFTHFLSVANFPLLLASRFVKKESRLEWIFLGAGLALLGASFIGTLFFPDPNV